MPVTTYTLTGDFSALVGEVTSLRATIHANGADQSWVNETDLKVVLGSALLPVAADGTFTVTLPTSTGTGLQYEVRAVYVDNGTRMRGSWASGWFNLTANGNLANLANDSSLRVNPSLGEQLAARIDGYLDHGDVSGVVSIDSDISTHVLDLNGDATLEFTTTNNGRGVLIRANTGDHSLTIGSETYSNPDARTEVGVLCSRDEWLPILGGGGGGTPSEPTIVTPGAVSFNDTGNVTTVSFTTGVQYKRNGVNISTQPTAPEPAGPVTYTAVARTGYVLASGATASWSHTYPAPPADSYAVVARSLNPLIALDLDDAAGTTSPAQEGSSSATATASGAVAFGVRTGLGGYAKAADFSGGDGKVSIPDVTSGLSAFSITVLIDPDSSVTNFLGEYNTPAWSIYEVSDKVVYKIGGDAVISTPDAPTVAHLVGMSYDGSTIYGYINGELVGTKSHAGAIAAMGTNRDIGGLSTDAAINGVMIWNRALSDSEHADLASAAGL